MKNMIWILLLLPFFAQAQLIKGRVMSEGIGVADVHIVVIGTNKHTITDSLGKFSIDKLPGRNFTLAIQHRDYKILEKKVVLNDSLDLTLNLTKLQEELSEVVFSGTMKEVDRLKSIVPVETYSPSYFKRNPTANVYEALSQINGIRPQLNCNICNTGDIHINGLEGPYTMILIDGMPIISGLATVYGLMGVPMALIEKVEVVKGPASSLYGSEAIGGLINIITKKIDDKAVLTADGLYTTYKESNIDLGMSIPISEKLKSLTGINYYHYDHPVDFNKDNFTDVTLQKRISVFHKLNIKRLQNRVFTLAARYNYEDRWGGEMQWDKRFRGSNEVYGESIYTNRYEFIGNYQLPIKEKMFLSFSFNDHTQNSYYGQTKYFANQKVMFSQFLWDKSARNNDWLAGIALRYVFYDDNTPATANELAVKNSPDKSFLPGVFIQNELKINQMQNLLIGVRYDYHSKHGSIFTPRLAYKYNFNESTIFRANAGTGFRVVNIFTEDHAALTGAKKLVIAPNLKPEKSYNINLNFAKQFNTSINNVFSIDLTGFYTYFTNRIIANYDANPNEIFYDNLSGYAVSSGLTLNFDAAFWNGWKINLGFTTMDVFLKEPGERKAIPYLTERFSGVWNIGYEFLRFPVQIDYTGNVYGKMYLPVLNELDPRSEISPAWSLQNIQFTFKGFKNNLEIFGGIKNLLNFKPGKKDPFLIARSNDPFNKKVQYDRNGIVKQTADNPFALQFDPTFIYAPNQGTKLFVGIRMGIK